MNTETFRDNVMEQVTSQIGNDDVRNNLLDWLFR